MLRHGRATVRHQRERYMRRRRVQFARWLGTIDYGAGHHRNANGFYPLNAPRPLEVRQAEFWDGRRMGMFAKWNGVCSCWMCQPRKAYMDRARLKTDLHRILTDEGTG